MEWYNYFAAFWAGAFLGNFIPHFVKGVCGDPFPTLFSSPPGQGLSNPMVNVVWALFNLVVGYLLWGAGKVSFQNNLSIAVCFAGFTVISIYASYRFATKHKV